VQRRGSIALLEEWLTTGFRTDDASAVQDVVETFREIRRRRQKPAHVVDDDAYDPNLFAEQREVFLRAYDAVRTLRLILANHPKARPAEAQMDERVRVGEIWPV
jgi:hypothetical protein